MNTLATRLLLAGTALSAFHVAPALAQDTEEADAASSAGDIIVTARRVEERLQDVPISITVFNQEQLDSRNVVSGNDLAAYTPSLSVNTRFGNDYASFSIRGFYQENRTTASVGVYFAEVVAPRGGGSTQGGDGAGPGAFFDLQNVQVLKGPQGTLFGRNTTGGAVLLVPRKPTDELEGYIEGGLGNYDMRRFQGVLNIPLAETFKVRVGVDRQKRDGYLRNVSGIGPNRFADSDYIAARLSILAELTPDLENYTIFSYSNSKTNGTIPKITNCFQNSLGTFGQPGFFPPPNAGGFMLGELACAAKARTDVSWNAVENNLPDAKQNAKQWQVINTTTWTVSDTLTVKNIMSYAELEHKQTTDLFGVRYVIPAQFPFYTAATNTRSTLDLAALGLGSFIGKSFIFVPVNSIPNGSRASNSQSTFSEELQVQGNMSDGRLRWQAGAYFEKSTPLGISGNLTPVFLGCTDIATFTCTDYLGTILKARLGLPLNSPAVVIGSMNYQGNETTFRNIGLYAQADYDITEQLKVTAGFRYTWDRTTTTADRVTYRFPAPNTPIGFCTNPLLRPPTSPLPAPNAQDLCRVPQDAVPTFNAFARQNSKAPTWVLSLDYKPIEDILLYAKWSRGYRQGATQPFGPDGLPPFKQEKVDTYEVGAKASFDGAVSGSFNVAGFYNDFTNHQINASYSLPRLTGVAPNAGLVNADKVRIYGLEAEAVLIPVEGLRLQAAYAYLNSKIQELSPLPEVPAFFPATHLVQEGGELPYTPNHKFTADASYTLPLDDSIGEIMVGTTYSYTGEQFYQSASSAVALAFLGPAPESEVYNIKSYDLWNIYANWNGIMGSGFDLTFFMNNVANKHYFLARNLQPSPVGIVSRYVAEPRLWGFKLRYNF